MNKLKIEYEIKERKDIINKYLFDGTIDREKAISKIQSLRLTDSKVAELTEATMFSGSVPFAYASNEQIIGELQMQIEILFGELIEKRSESYGN